MAFAASFGLPPGCSVPQERREAKFLMGFPDAVDVIVRGIKAGLPLLDSMRIITHDAPEPLKSEVPRGARGPRRSASRSERPCGKLYERIPVPEANFFGIVVGIQQKAGGNLSEALGNLSRVLRDRKKMKAKIQAMSMEAKASAAHHRLAAAGGDGDRLLHQPAIYRGCCGPIPWGRVMLAGCAIWMSIGILVMRKMITFDF